MFDMLRRHGTCGTTTRFNGEGSHLASNVKESHYITDTHGPPSRDVYTSTYPVENCESLCHVDATGGMIVPLATARLRAMMTSLEAVRPPMPLLPACT
jgi:hypothetical protein